VKSVSTSSGLHLSGVDKTFAGVRALDNVGLDVAGGTVHALLGHNGCGKSTLVKTLAGFHAPDHECEATIDGVSFELGNAAEAARHGISFVHQDLGLILQLGAADNIGFVLGYEKDAGRIRWGRQGHRVNELLRDFDIDIDPQAPLTEASPTVRTAVAIVRAVAGWTNGSGLLVLDEPTAALPAREVDQLFRVIRKIRDSGTAILMISHRMDEVMSIADRVTVMRAGRVIWDGVTDDLSLPALTTLIVGAEVEAIEEKPVVAARPRPDRAPVLEVRGLRGKFIENLYLQVHPGEIVGIAGLLGSGREELPYIVAGASPDYLGTVAVGGHVIDAPSPQQSRARGVAFAPADRARESIVGDFSVRENVSLGALPTVRTKIGISYERERAFARTWLGQVSATSTAMQMPITTLSGGNQQKAVLARCLSVEPVVLVVSEPTAGIDIGARTAIYELLRARAGAGLAVLMSSSDPEDLVAVCDRVVVLRDGVVSAELRASDISKSAIVAAMEGADS
jgi:ribose transport system ATP-binding protein